MKFLNEFAPIFYLIIGWILGLFSTFIVRLFDNKRERNLFKKKLYSELNLIMPRIIGIYYALNTSLGNMDKEKLNWTYDMANKYPDGLKKEIIENIKKLKEQDDSEIKAFSLQSIKDKSIGKTIIKFDAPILQSYDNAISLFKIDFQKDFLAIRFRINWMNELIELSQYFFRKTFDSNLSPENHKVISSNEIKSYRDIADLTKSIAEIISNFMEKYFKNFK